MKLQGPADPMIELSRAGDTVRARVTGGAGYELRFVRDGTPLDPVAVDTDPFEHALVLAPASGESRIRAEVLLTGKPRTVTSHLWLRTPDPAPLEASPAGGCGCRQASTGSAHAVAAFLALALALRARRARYSSVARPRIEPLMHASASSRRRSGVHGMRSPQGG